MNADHPLVLLSFVVFLFVVAVFIIRGDGPATKNRRVWSLDHRHHRYHHRCVVVMLSPSLQYQYLIAGNVSTSFVDGSRRFCHRRWLVSE